MKKQVIILTGGGSAGHVMPNLALAPRLKELGYDVHYIGTQNGIERQIVTKLPYHPIEAGKLRRYFSVENFKDFFKIFKGYRESLKILKELQPALVFSKGGFVSVPVVYAASKLSIPVVLHESDFSPGLANRLCAKKAQKICLSFDNNIASPKYTYTGSPLRSALLNGNKEQGLNFLKFSDKMPVLLIMGGSLGAKTINDAVDAALPELLKKYQVIHLRGKGNLNTQLNKPDNYRQFEFLSDELADIFAAADAAVSRSGANAVFEFLALKIPSLLIPLPLSASRGDQIQNAAYFEKKGFSKVLPQENLTSESLINGVNDLFENLSDYKLALVNEKGADGTSNVVDVIKNSISNNGS